MNVRRQRTAGFVSQSETLTIVANGCRRMSGMFSRTRSKDDDRVVDRVTEHGEHRGYGRDRDS